LLPGSIPTIWEETSREILRDRSRQVGEIYMSKQVYPLLYTPILRRKRQFKAILSIFSTINTRV
jgi:hypothetical protein